MDQISLKSALNTQASSLLQDTNWFIYIYTAVPRSRLVLIVTLGFYFTVLTPPPPSLLIMWWNGEWTRRGASVGFLVDLMVFILPLRFCGLCYWWLSSASPSCHPFCLFAELTFLWIAPYLHSVCYRYLSYYWLLHYYNFNHVFYVII